MTTVTPGAVFPVNAPFNTNPAYSGTFIPTIWSSKMLQKFYTATVLGAISNTDYTGEIKDRGDKVVINTIPTITIRNYVVGTNLNYEVPTPNTIEMVVDQGKYFAFQVNDVLAHQSMPGMIDSFSNDASEQMKITIDSTVLYRSALGAGNIVAANKGATAGKNSASYNLGTDTAPLQITPANVLQTITAMAAVLDEQNIPDNGRWLVISPADRQILLNSNLMQAQMMGDGTSVMRNGKVGRIDRFDVYLSNQLPKAAANATNWMSGDGSEANIATSGTLAKRVIVGGQSSWLAFATQLTKMETVRNPNDFGDFIRGLQVYGSKALQPTAATLAIVR